MLEQKKNARQGAPPREAANVGAEGHVPKRRARRLWTSGAATRFRASPPALWVMESGTSDALGAAPLERDWTALAERGGAEEDKR